MIRIISNPTMTRNEIKEGIKKQIDTITNRYGINDAKDYGI